jgi:hypothetical protein
MNRYMFRYFINVDGEILRGRPEVFTGDNYAMALCSFNDKYGFMNEVEDTENPEKAKQGIYAWRLMDKTRINE